MSFWPVSQQFPSSDNPLLCDGDIELSGFTGSIPGVRGSRSSQVNIMNFSTPYMTFACEGRAQDLSSAAPTELHTRESFSRIRNDENPFTFLGFLKKIFKFDSTISSSYNARAAVIWDDTVKHFFKTTEARSLLILKILGMYGICPHPYSSDMWDLGSSLRNWVHAKSLVKNWVSINLWWLWGVPEMLNILFQPFCVVCYQPSWPSWPLNLEGTFCR